MRWLIDEMLPPDTAIELERLGHEATGVVAAGLGETNDEVIYAVAVDQQRVIVTENFADFAAISAQRIAGAQPVVPVVFVQKRALPRGGALSHHLAQRLHEWAAGNPEPYPGPHWL